MFKGEILMTELKNKTINGNNMEEIVIRVVKFMLEEGYSLDVIKDITEIDIEKIKEIEGLVD